MRKPFIALILMVTLLSGCSASTVSVNQILVDVDPMMMNVATQEYVPNKENNFFLYYLPKGFIEKNVYDNNVILASPIAKTYIHVNPNRPDMLDSIDQTKIVEERLIQGAQRDVNLYILSTDVADVYSVVFIAPFARINTTLRAEQIPSQIDYLTMVALSIQVKPGNTDRIFIGKNQQNSVESGSGTNDGVLLGPED